jgi:hypothetical protein
MTEIANPLCLWCGKPFTRRRSGGSRQTFCGQPHRIAFHTAARRWAERAITSGVLTIAELQNAAAGACTLSGGHETSDLVPDTSKSVSTSVGEPQRFGVTSVQS